MYLFQFEKSSRAITFALDEELRKGRRILEIPALFTADEGRAGAGSAIGSRTAWIAALALSGLAAGVLALARSRVR